MHHFPENPALDALHHRALDHAAVRPQFLLQLLEAELYTVTPRGQSGRPADSITRPQGKNIEMMRWGKDGKQSYAVYTSPRMARKGRATLQNNTPTPLVIIALPGRAMLERMQRPNVYVSVNSGSGGEGSLMIGHTTVVLLLTGGLVEEFKAGDAPQYQGAVQAVPPMDYPTPMVQAAFEFLRAQPPAAAAWIVEPVDPALQEHTRYLIAVLLVSDEHAARLYAGLRIVLATVDASLKSPTEVIMLDIAEPMHVALMKQQPPFFAAPDFALPAS